VVRVSACVFLGLFNNIQSSSRRWTDGSKFYFKRRRRPSIVHSSIVPSIFICLFSSILNWWFFWLNKTTATDWWSGRDSRESHKNVLIRAERRKVDELQPDRMLVSRLLLYFRSATGRRIAGPTTVNRRERDCVSVCNALILIHSGRIEGGKEQQTWSWSDEKRGKKRNAEISKKKQKKSLIWRMDGRKGKKKREERIWIQKYKIRIEEEEEQMLSWE